MHTGLVRFDLSACECSDVGRVYFRMPRFPSCNWRGFKRLDGRSYWQNQVQIMETIYEPEREAQGMGPLQLILGYVH